MFESQTAHDLSPGLLRQRRNLMLISLILLFTNISEADFSSISLLGLETTFGKPEAVHWFLLAFSVYFAYRYFVYLLQEPNSYFRPEFFRRLDRFAKLKLLSKRDQIFPAAAGMELGGDLAGTGYGKFPNYEMQVIVTPPKSGSSSYGRMKVNVLALWWQCPRAFVETVLFRSYLTDYILPFILVVGAWITVLLF